jgi:hypothetical protein
VSACVTAAKLKGIKRLEVWAEGKNGKIHLDLQSIAAEASGIVAQVTPAATSDMPLVTFDGNSATTFGFKALLDPVMGGRSTGTWTVNTAGHYGILDGEVVDVPQLKAPGFITAHAEGKFRDVSKAIDGSLVLMVRSSTPEFQGFRVSFASGTVAPGYSCAGGGSLPFSGGCYKSPQFAVPAGDNFVAITIPFNKFSDHWSPSTGEQSKTCAEDKSVCPTGKALEGIKRVEIWAEGAKGKVHIELQSIFARVADNEVFIV